ncbi:MBL fold metallo-hydrolase [Rhodanobacter sp. Root627]|uniref:MBL fold metallo-hydrolase n=1 Tax=Rhodanobacter sp. Root627 TaxID=1736572 RepID=UPI0006F83F77|nr:MBL fold metallo-hydrolase [Rhodanobacter sp. Root627]KRA36244.1 MBL fold metallo-hydrolase [Rhodanobacter sp. Root627]
MRTHLRGNILRATTAAILLGLTASSVLAAAPMAQTSAPGYYRFMLGNFEVTALSDGTVDLPVDQLLQEPAAKTVAALNHAFQKTPQETSDNAYLINTGKRLILIDTGAGDLFGPTLGKLMGNLKASGYTAADVDDILLTHMHPDHIGGLAKNGVIQFPNAIVHAERDEGNYWLSETNLAKAPDASKAFFKDAMAEVDPYVKAGKFRPFKGDVALLPGVSSYTSFGHTAGHTSYMIESQGQKLLVMGDLIHVPAVQLDHPNVTISFDSDPKEAAASRIRVFNAMAKDRTLVAGAHIPFPGVGHLRTAGTSYQWVPVNFSRMRPNGD